MGTFEERVRAAAKTGEWVDLSVEGEPEDPAEHESWSAEREVPAEVLARVLTAPGDDAVAVRIRGARIAGDLDLGHRQLKVSILLERCAFLGEVGFDEAAVPSLALTGSLLAKGLSGMYLTIERTLDLESCRITGPVILPLLRAHLVTIGDAVIDAEDDDAVSLDGGEIGIGVGLVDSVVNGMVSLSGMRIAGMLDLTGATVRRRGGLALSAEDCEVGFDVRMDRLTAEGAVNLHSMRIGGSLHLPGAKLSHPNDNAISLEDCRIGGDLYLREGFSADGAVRLLSAEIGDRIELNDARISDIINAVDASIGVLHDDPACWPDGSLIHKMRYGSLLTGPHGGARVRLAWLARLLPTYEPQPYTQLAAVYREAGNDTAVRDVLIAKQRARRRSWSPWSAFLRWTIAYGYSPARALYWAAGLLAAAIGVFATAPKGAFTSTATSTDPFNPYIYALETLVPLANLGGTQWTPHGAYIWWRAGFALAGWIFAAIVTAGIAGVFKRD